ncbi:hypothetical protein [Mesorhizobium sp.]|uniref:hypothetical protein n=1 Tax=Mesorhizobium sp. TaxID=1871066 RepID=UPI00121B3B6B|nr:hypothetical protein [Mesorhizobium sp.]TIL38118.1 MAG: hypothetical protein E5Y82_15965 [Mesorhizobium sp.]
MKRRIGGVGQSKCEPRDRPHLKTPALLVPADNDHLDAHSAEIETELVGAIDRVERRGGKRRLATEMKAVAVSGPFGKKADAVAAVRLSRTVSPISRRSAPCERAVRSGAAIAGGAFSAPEPSDGRDWWDLAVCHGSRLCFERSADIQPVQ